MDTEELEQLLLKIMQDFRTTAPLHSGLDYDEIKSRLMPFTSMNPVELMRWLEQLMHISILQLIPGIRGFYVHSGALLSRHQL